MGGGYRHCSEYERPRPPDATHRVIEAVRFELEIQSDDGATRSGALIVWLTLNGQPQNRGGIAGPIPGNMEAVHWPACSASGTNTVV